MQCPKVWGMQLLLLLLQYKGSVLQSWTIDLEVYKQQNKSEKHEMS